MPSLWFRTLLNLPVPATAAITGRSIAAGTDTCHTGPMGTTSGSSRGQGDGAGSILSIGSSGSILSIGSAGSILSIGSAGSVACLLGVGSAASVGSVLSALSRWSVLAWRSSGTVGNKPAGLTPWRPR